ncbi:hypothetical protein LTR08_001924 [Meristemomyces frigidus]|nr:hypothetical protein LTR08_001924 [Meristemomyces frigidus]
MGIGEYVVHALAVLYGLATLVFFSLWALVDGSNWKSETPARSQELEKAHHDLWHLANPSSTHHHNFLTLSSGLQLHYLSNSPAGPAKALVLFLHGFPDSAHIFSRVLASESLQRSGIKLVALDLPGYGGSDGLRRYGASEVLNAVVEALMRLKKLYLPEDGIPCILVGHDWGGAIAFRIASETAGLVDRVVVLNSMHIPHGKANITACVSRAEPLFSAWTSRPWQLHLLQAAFHELSPITQQLLKSSYIFMFNLPLPLPLLSPAITQFITLCHRHLSRTQLPPAYMIATSNGPSPREATSRTADGYTYPPTVLARTRTERIRLYREGLGTSEWTPNSSTTTSYVKPASRNAEQGEPARKEGSFNYPLTTLFGLDDLAFDTRVVLDGLQHFFLEPAAGASRARERQSHIVRLPGRGHWFFARREGADVVVKTLRALVAVHGQAMLSESHADEGGLSSSGTLDEILRREVKVAGGEGVTVASSYP